MQLHLLLLYVYLVKTNKTAKTTQRKAQKEEGMQSKTFNKKEKIKHESGFLHWMPVRYMLAYSTESLPKKNQTKHKKEDRLTVKSSSFNKL